jgi:hypothetical protein
MSTGKFLFVKQRTPVIRTKKQENLHQKKKNGSETGI